jgi:2-polyprenyl-3-methyl-5-hydroxy-6-metoxy-1,4-benzoquinol methylase
MNRNYWEKIAPDYSDEIFDVLHNDKKGIIRAAIKKHSSRSKTVMDIGCAIGKWLPVLSPLFKKVYAIDISQQNLAIAKKRNSTLKNIEYMRADMSGKKTKPPKGDLGICINAILTSSMKDRKVFFNSLANSIKRGGYIILVIPSLESYLLTNIIASTWKIDKDIFGEKVSGAVAIQKWNNIVQGNVDIDNVATKHYLEEELRLLLSRQGFEAEEFQKIEYNWNTEFMKPPKWLKEPKPWDWMVIARKK